MIAPSNRQVHQWFLLYLSLSSVIKGVVAGVFLMIVLFVFTAITSAVCELSGIIHQLYTTSDNLTRLIILVIGAYLIRKAYPLAKRIVRF